MLSKSEKIDPRVKRTRQLILNAFMELIPTNSFQAMTVQDITEKAGINRATFYAHFIDKYQLHEEALGEWFQQQLEQALNRNEGFSHDNLGRLIGLVCQFFQGMNGNCHPADRDYKPLIERQIQSKVYQCLLEWIEPYSAKPQLEATAISWAIFGLGLSWSKGEIKQSQEELSRELIQFVEKSLGQGVIS